MARPDLTPHALLALIDAQDVDGVVALFDGATEADRSRVHPLVWQLRYDTAGQHRGNVALDVAGMGAFKPAEVAAWQFVVSSHPESASTAVTVLSQRSTAFRSGLAKKAFTDRSARWDFVRPLVRAGILDPTARLDRYLNLMVHGLTASWEGDPAAIRNGLLADPGLLEHELWQVFETPGAAAKWLAPAWAEALAGLVADHHVDRDRLLDAVLAALAGDLRPGELTWHAAVFRALEPDGTELAERSHAALALAQSGDGATAKLGLELAVRLEADGSVDPEDLVDVLRSAVAARQKNTAVAALTLLDRIGTPSALVAMAGAVGHERADVAERAVAMIATRTGGSPDDDLRAELLVWLDGAPPTVQAAAAKLLGTTTGAAPAVSGPVELPPIVQPSIDDALADSRLLHPVSDLDEVVALFAAALEGVGSADDVGRAIAAALATSDRPPGFDDLVSPLRKRARSLVEGRPALFDPIAAIVLAWTDGEPVPPVPEATGPLVSALRPGGSRFVIPRPSAGPRDSPQLVVRRWAAEVIGALVAGVPVMSLSAPTHAGGFVHPDELARRRADGGGIGPIDEQLARLRAAGPSIVGVTGATVVPDGRATSLRWDLVHEAPADPLVASWLGAHGQPVEGVSDRGRSMLTSIPDRWWDVRGSLQADLALSLVPADPSMAVTSAAGGIVRLRASAWSQVDAVPVLRRLAEPVIPLDGAVPWLLALGLTDEPEVRSASVDVVVRGIDRSAVDPSSLADALAELQRAGLVTLARLGPPVADIAASGDVHRAVTIRLLVELVAAIGDDRPTGLHVLVESLAQIAGGGLVLAEGERAVLERLAVGSSKAAKLAKGLLAGA